MLNEAKIKPLRDALAQFERALADGHKIEAKRLNALVEVWGLTIGGENSVKCAVAVENVLKSSLKNADWDLANSLTEKEQSDLCLRLYKTLARNLKIQELPKSLILEKLDEVIQLLSIREAWLYREYQTGIGDLVLSKTSRGDKLYTVIGYEEFETLLLSTDNHHARWVSRLEILFDQLDIENAVGSDARLYLLEQTFIGLAKVLIALSALQKRRPGISAGALEKAQEIISDNSWRRAHL